MGTGFLLQRYRVSCAVRHLQGNPDADSDVLSMQAGSLLQDIMVLRVMLYTAQLGITNRRFQLSRWASSLRWAPHQHKSNILPESLST